MKKWLHMAVDNDSLATTSSNNLCLEDLGAFTTAMIIQLAKELKIGFDECLDWLRPDGEELSQINELIFNNESAD